MEYNETLSHKKGFGLSLLKVKVYGTRLKWSIVVGCLVATVLASPGKGGGGWYSREFLVGVCCPFLRNLTFSDQTSKILAFGQKLCHHYLN